MKTKLFKGFIIMLTLFGLVFSFASLYSNSAQAQNKANGESCNLSSECQSENCSSDTLKCIPKKKRIGGFCTTQSECISENCYNGQCRGNADVGSNCMADYDCSAGNSCVQNQCAAQQKIHNAKKCTSNNDCSLGQKCVGYSDNKDSWYCAEDFYTDGGGGCGNNATCSLYSGCENSSCTCIPTQGSSPFACVPKARAAAGAACSTSQDCGFGLSCKNYKCTQETDSKGLYEECGTPSQCSANSLTCRAADGNDTSKNKKLVIGKYYCLTTFGSGETCTSTLQCSDNQDCITTYPKGFTLNGKPRYWPDTDGKATCPKGHTKETRTSDGKTEYTCKSTEKRCATKDDPTTPDDIGDRGTSDRSNSGVQTCNKDVKKGLFTQNVSNQCINCGECTICDIVNTASSVGNSLLAIAAPLAGLFLIIGGVLYTTSGGNPERAGQAKKAIAASLIGLVLMLGAYLVVSTTMSAIGLQNTGTALSPNFKCDTTNWKWTGFGN